MESVWPVSKLSTKSVGNRRELVANCVHTADADATKQFRRVGSVCIGHYIHNRLSLLHLRLMDGRLLSTKSSTNACSGRAPAVSGHVTMTSWRCGDVSVTQWFRHLLTVVVVWPTSLSVSGITRHHCQTPAAGFACVPGSCLAYVRAYIHGASKGTPGDAKCFKEILGGGWAKIRKLGDKV